MDRVAVGWVESGVESAPQVQRLKPLHEDPGFKRWFQIGELEPLRLGLPDDDRPDQPAAHQALRVRGEAVDSRTRVEPVLTLPGFKC